jgi:hypothetical protein
MTALELIESHTVEVRVCDSCSITWRGPFRCWCCAGPGTVIYPEATK